VIDDDVDKILSYDKVTEAISDEVFAERVNLLETLAERIADRVLNEPQAHRVFVRIEKLDRGPGALGVEIVRTEKDYNSTTRSALNGDEISIRPHVIYLSNAAINSIHLDTWINQLSVKTQPVVLCVGVPEKSFEAKNQKPAILRRLDLLSIEQNAWILAGKNSKCVVVSTKTELDYAIKQGQISVWAPSKIILDANDPPEVDANHTYQLAYWLMNYLNGEKLSVIGVEPVLYNKDRLAVILPLKENIF
jgi:dihydroneopterin aldolase